jgi:hypothetical protein
MMPLILLRRRRKKKEITVKETNNSKGISIEFCDNLMVKGGWMDKRIDCHPFLCL